VSFPSSDAQHVCEWVRRKYGNYNDNYDICNKKGFQWEGKDKSSCYDDDGDNTYNNKKDIYANDNDTRYTDNNDYNNHNENYENNENGIFGKNENDNCDYNCNNNCHNSGNNEIIDCENDKDIPVDAANPPVPPSDCSSSSSSVNNRTKHHQKQLEINDNGSLTIQMGDFLRFYSHKDQANQFDCVVTCFFLDTATNIIDYLAVISHILRPGGIFLNTGPLHYHSNNTIQYSYTQLIEIIQIGGFDVISQSRIDATSYSGEEEFSMKPEYYTVPLDIFQLNRKKDRWPLPVTEVDVDDNDIDDEIDNDFNQKKQNNYAGRPDFALR
jgi:hypothetical protein